MNKLGRNEPCSCGSGKKYKKCCSGKITCPVEPNKTSPNVHTTTSRDTQKSVFAFFETTTGEWHLPVRLYYEIEDKARLIADLNRLQCVHQVSEDRWDLLYDHEAKNFGLDVKYNEVPKETFPLVLGYIHLVSDKELHIDVRSFKRAARMIEFIDRHICRLSAKITYAASHTKIMEFRKENLQDMHSNNLEHFFMSEDIKEINTERAPRKIKPVTDENIHEVLCNVFDEIAGGTPRESLIEKFPVHYYRVGIKTFEGSLALTELVAMKRLLGNSSYSAQDGIREIAKDMLNES